MKHLLFVALLFFVSCKKAETFAPTTQPPPINHSATGVFSFTFNTKSINGQSFDCLMNKSSIGDYLIMRGSSSVFTLEFFIKMPSNNIVLGQYHTTDYSNYMKYSFKYSNTDHGSYTASKLYLNSGITFNVVSYNATTKAISCTFNGLLQSDFDNTTYKVDNGIINGIRVL